MTHRSSVPVDSRIRRWKAIVDDDLRCEISEMLDEVDCHPLNDALRYTDWLLSALDRADAVLATKKGLPDAL